MDARFFTVTDSRFYVGTVALLNSIRLTGHDQELVVLDRGLTPEQRSGLSDHATIFDLADDVEGEPYLVKPFPVLTGFEGVVVLIDSDIVVTDALDATLARAASGRICLFPDHPVDYWRWFAEWQDLFELKAPLRRQPYLNSGFLAVSTAHWPTFFRRWWDACALIPARRSSLPESEYEPFAQPDQDALNAILMSEVPAEKVEQLPAYEWDLRRVVIEDQDRLLCVSRARRQPLLHAPLLPKVWHRDGWRRAWPDAYVRLLPRLLFSADLALRLAPVDVPYWVRPGLLPRLSVNVLGWYRPLPALAVRARRAPRRLAREMTALLGRSSSRS